jgi:hypothetical protein
MNNVEKLKWLLLQDKILHFKNLNNETIDEMLESRDGAEFESDWLRVFETLEQKEFSNADIALIDEIREIAYKKSFASTNHAELAAYIADDFELIVKSLLSGLNDEWLNALLLAYLQGLFPHTKLLPKNNGLELILETASIQQLAA